MKWCWFMYCIDASIDTVSQCCLVSGKVLVTITQCVDDAHQLELLI